MKIKEIVNSCFNQINVGIKAYLCDRTMILSVKFQMMLTYIWIKSILQMMFNVSPLYSLLRVLYDAFILLEFCQNFFVSIASEFVYFEHILC